MEEPFFRFSKLSIFPELVHGISNRNYSDMKFGNLPDSEVVKNRRAFFQDLGVEESRVIIPKQIHGNQVEVVGINKKGQTPLADGLITMEKDLYLMVMVADCLPVLMYDPVLRVTAAVHAGWRGIVSQIIPETLVKFKNLGSDMENIIVGIGPGICQKHFIVRSGVLEKFRDNYPKATLLINNDGYVDLKKAATIDFEKNGVILSNIEVSKLCTVCDNGIYSSYRKEGSGVIEMAALIGMRK